MKKGDTIYVKSTVGNLPICSMKSGKIIYITKFAGEVRKIRLQVEKEFSFSHGFSTTNHKTTIRLLCPSVQVFTDRQKFLESINSLFLNFNKILLKSSKEIEQF